MMHRRPGRVLSRRLFNSPMSAPRLTLTRGQRMEVLSILKRTGGLPVRPLSARMGMSYMGVKQYCLELEKKGFLETWRQPRGAGRGGRPEMLYRLTDRAHALFPAAQNDLTLELLEAVQKVYGSAAPEKLLFTVFQNRADHYLKNLPKYGSLALRTALFARLRDQEGCMAELDGAMAPPSPAPAKRNSGKKTGAAPKPHAADEVGDLFEAMLPPPDEPLRIIEHRSPIADLQKRFPILARLERDLFERVLHAPVKRVDESKSPERYRVVFEIGKPAT
jgi:predicted ArsR family transcriptional regulator